MLKPDRIFCSLDVTVSDNGNVECICDHRDLFPTRGATVHLRSRSRMNRECARACVLTAQRDTHGIAHLFAPSAANLHRDRQMCVLRNRANDRLNQIEILEATRSAVSPHDFLNRTTEVDVDELRLKNFRNERGSFSHSCWIGSKDLHADWSLIRG